MTQFSKGNYSKIQINTWLSKREVIAMNSELYYLLHFLQLDLRRDVHITSGVDLDSPFTRKYLDVSNGLLIRSGWKIFHFNSNEDNKNL